MPKRAPQKRDVSRRTVLTKIGIDFRGSSELFNMYWKDLGDHFQSTIDEMRTGEHRDAIIEPPPWAELRRQPKQCLVDGIARKANLGDLEGERLDYLAEAARRFWDKWSERPTDPPRLDPSPTQDMSPSQPHRTGSFFDVALH
ncbi:MAG: hypothetical protein M1825_003554 [Sarcosagium campestre]|nr:MAG: hypothetical protein M1825_003554 [Sarcosagium campestre]